MNRRVRGGDILNWGDDIVTERIRRDYIVSGRIQGAIL